jgi:hypothetical protein
MVSIQRILYYRPFAPLIRGTEHTEDFILLIFAERAKINKPKPFGQNHANFDKLRYSDNCGGLIL